MAELPPEVLRVLQQGHGIVARQELLTFAGVPDNQLKSWVRHGRLIRYAHGVVGLPGLPDTREVQDRVALARCGRGARLGPIASLDRMHVEGFRRRNSDPSDIVLPAQRRVRHTDIDVRWVQLIRDDKAVVDHMPGLSAARSLIMVAPRLPEKALRVAIDDAIRKRKTSKRALIHRAESLTPASGAARIRHLLSDDAMQSESEGERLLWRYLRGITPPPERQVTDLVPGRRLDFAWRAYLYSIEFDGIAFHNPATSRDADGLRDLEASAANVVVQRVTYGMVNHDLGRTMQLIAESLARRAAQLNLPAPVVPQPK